MAALITVVFSINLWVQIVGFLTLLLNVHHVNCRCGCYKVPNQGITALYNVDCVANWPTESCVDIAVGYRVPIP